MPVYEYTALDSSGKTLRGIIDADSKVAARQKLRTGGRFPVSVQETQVRSKEEAGRQFSLFQRVSDEEIHAVTRQLSTLLGAGIPLVSALDALIQQAVSPSLKKVVSQIKESVNEGNSFTHAVSEHPKLFSKIYINMVRAGEASGSLDVVLDRLAEFGEHQQALKGRFKAALIYPLFMGLVGCGVLMFLVAFVVPNITQIFTDMEQALPLSTTILINFSNFIGTYWWVILLAAAGVFLGIRQFIRTARGQYVWDGIKLRMPIVGQVNRKLALARFGRTLGSLLESGVPMLTSLQIVRNIVNNILISEVVDEAIEEIRAGRSLHSVLAQSSWFPPMYVQMVSVGEQSGELEAMLGKVADAYEREVETSIMGMTALIEPIMILGMGVVVAFIVISILLPIFEMNQLVR